MSDDVATRLNALDAGALAALLSKRAVSDEDFRLWLATELAALGARELRTPLDPEPFRVRAEALLDSTRGGQRGRHRDDFGSSSDEAALDELIAQAEPFLGLGDGNNALAILKPVAASLVEYWPQCADWDETLHEFSPLLDAMIARAVLLDGVSHEARDDLADELSHWQDEVSEYGDGDAFAVAIAAATQGWDEPGLEDVLDGRLDVDQHGLARAKQTQRFVKGLVGSGIFGKKELAPIMRDEQHLLSQHTCLSQIATGINSTKHTGAD